jgi:hypothetical protein
LKLFFTKKAFLLGENDGPGPYGAQGLFYMEKSLRETSIEVRRVKIFERKIIISL